MRWFLRPAYNRRQSLDHVGGWHSLDLSPTWNAAMQHNAPLRLLNACPARCSLSLRKRTYLAFIAYFWWSHARLLIYVYGHSIVHRVIAAKATFTPSEIYSFSANSVSPGYISRESIEFSSRGRPFRCGAFTAALPFRARDGRTDGWMEEEGSFKALRGPI